MSDSPPNPDLEQVRETFITQWGVIGNAWGINRTMAQIHALLLVSVRPMNTDQIMEALSISRGNAHNNLKELSTWGLVRGVHIKGDRKEYFEAESDIWKLFCTITRERKKREVDPALEVLATCRDGAESLEGEEAERFRERLEELTDFVGGASKVMDRITAAESSAILSRLLKLLG